MGKFEIKKSNDGEFHFDLKTSNGHVILSSNGYPQKVSCIDTIRSIKKNAQDDSRFDKVSNNGKYYFNIKSSNGKIIGRSEFYDNESSMCRGIESVKTNALTAKVEDLT